MEMCGGSRKVQHQPARFALLRSAGVSFDLLQNEPRNKAVHYFEFVIVHFLDVG